MRRSTLVAIGRIRGSWKELPAVVPFNTPTRLVPSCCIIKPLYLHDLQLASLARPSVPSRVCTTASPPHQYSLTYYCSPQQQSSVLLVSFQSLEFQSSIWSAASTAQLKSHPAYGFVRAGLSDPTITPANLSDRSIYWPIFYSEAIFHGKWQPQNSPSW